MESVSCCYHDDNPAMSNECGTRLSEAGGWWSLNKQARYQSRVQEEERGMTERRQGADVTVFLSFLLNLSFLGDWTHTQTWLTRSLYHSKTIQSSVLFCFFPSWVTSVGAQEVVWSLTSCPQHQDINVLVSPWIQQVFTQRNPKLTRM